VSVCVCVSLSVYVCVCGLRHQNHVARGVVSVYVYHGGARTTDKHELLSHDVIITTYGILQTEAAQAEAEQRHAAAKQERGDGGPTRLFQSVHWLRYVQVPTDTHIHVCAYIGACGGGAVYVGCVCVWVGWGGRVVLDEAHSIKSRKAKQTIAACQLKYVLSLCAARGAMAGAFRCRCVQGALKAIDICMCVLVFMCVYRTCLCKCASLSLPLPLPHSLA
jgi:hypothetical protein